MKLIKYELNCVMGEKWTKELPKPKQEVEIKIYTKCNHAVGEVMENK